MPVVQMPDGRTVEFPEGTTPEVMERALQGFTSESAPGWAPTAVARGVGDLIGLPREIGNIGRSLAASALEQFDRQGVPMLPGQQPRAQMAADLRATNAAPGTLPTSERAGAAIMDAAGITPTEPQTGAGRIAAEGVRFAAGSALGLGLPSAVRNLIAGGVAGLSSGAAGEATRGTAIEGGARIAGALAPAAVGGAAAVLRGNPVRDAARALEGLTPQQADAARALMAEAERAGSPITIAEAVQQIAGSNRNLRAAQDLAQSTVGGSRVMNPFLDARDAGARQAATQFAETFAPVGSNAAMIPARIQDAAEAEIRGARLARSQAVRPLFATAATDAAQPGRANAVTAFAGRAATRLDDIAARDVTNTIGPQLSAYAAEIRAINPANGALDWERLNDIRREIRDLMMQRGDRALTAPQRKFVSEAQGVISEMGRNLERAVPSLGVANREYIRLTQEVVEPVERGIIGRVSETNSAQAQRSLLFPRAPMGGDVPTTPQAAGEAFGRLAGPQAQRPRVGVNDLENARGLLGVELRARLDEAFQARASGPSERPGAAAAARLAPTEGRSDALVAAFRALPGGDQAAAGFTRLMDVLEAQQYAPVRGSQTAPRAEMAQRASGGARAATNPVGEFKRFVEDWSRNANTENLARALTTPEGFNMLRAMAGIQSPEAAESVIRQILTYERARRAGEER